MPDMIDSEFRPHTDAAYPHTDATYPHEADHGARLRNQMGILTIDDLSAVLSVGPQTLALWRVRGIGPDFVKGSGTKAVFYRREDVQTWLALNVFLADRRAGAA